MVHLGNNKYFLDKFYANILFNKKYDIYEILHYQQAYIDLTTNRLYIEQIPEIHKENCVNFNYENIHLKYHIDGEKNEPNFKIDNTDYYLYKFNNITNYQYIFCQPQITITKVDKLVNDNLTYYIIFDCPGLDAFAHWVYESFIFFQLLEELNKLYPNIKILTTNKKKYVLNLFNFVGIKNEIVYKIEDKNNICFIPPIISLNANVNIELFNFFINKFIDRIELNTVNFNYDNKFLFLPRNKKDNYFPDDKIPVHLLRERRNSHEIEYISDGVIKNGGTVLNTYEINNFFIQFSLIMNSKNIILDYGSSYFVNCIACKNKNLIILNPENMKQHIDFISLKHIHSIISSNNNVTILTEYNCYQDIARHFI